MTELLCQLQNIGFHYPGEKLLLNKINLELFKGSSLAILGASGSGKSTLAHLLSGFLMPTQGQIVWDPVFLQVTHPRQVYRKKQMVFQDPSSALTPFYTPYRTLYDILNLHFDLTKDELDEKIRHYLGTFGLDQKVFHQKNSKLSGGEKQRLCLARAFCLEPELIVLDEPLSSCDPFLQKEILNLIKQTRQKTGLTLVSILHNLHHASFIADKICLIHNGSIESYGSTQEFLSSPATSYTQKFVEAFY
jgi:ABC-type dipeptide/oligopeptide/nickel transport system ATPase subunit